jgi:ribonuclease BN (tRNA processing enzyme)
MSWLDVKSIARVRRSDLLSYTLVALLGYATSSTATSACRGDVALQVLGSGGPAPEGHRASSDYLVWVGVRSCVLVNAGGGVFLRFGEAHARIEDLDLIALTYFHADHVADFPALIKVASTKADITFYYPSPPCWVTIRGKVGSEAGKRSRNARSRGRTAYRSRPRKRVDCRECSRFAGAMSCTASR